MGPQIRPGLRQAATQKETVARGYLASGRGRDFRRRHKTLAVACSRSGRLCSRRDRPSLPRYQSCQAIADQAAEEQGLAPKRIVTDKLRSYGAARRTVMPAIEHRSHKGLNNRAENSHVPLLKRERMMQGFRSVGGLQRFTSVFSALRNLLSRRAINAQLSLPTFIGSAQWHSGKL